MAPRAPVAFLFALTLFFVAAVPGVLAQGLSPEDQADQFLSQLGLTELQILHWERELATPRADGKAADFAVRLADLYALYLMSINDAKRAEEVNRKIDALVSRYPQANTTSLQVMRLHGDYQRVETVVGKWVADSSQAKYREAAIEPLRKLAPQWDALRDRMLQELKRADDQLEKMPDGGPRKTKEQERNRIAQVAGKASFYSGWANCYLGLLIRSSGALGAGETGRAKNAFLKFLGLESVDDSMSAEDLGLAGEVSARVMLGLALAESADNPAVTARAFKLLRDPITNAEVREWVPFWEGWTLLRANRKNDFRQLAAREINAFSGAASAGKVGLCILLVNAGFGDPAALDSELGMLGVAGLTRMQRHETVRQLLSQLQVDLSKQPGFVPQWVAGQRLFDLAEKTRAPDDYHKARDALLRALAAPEAALEPTLAAHCRYTLGWCHFRTGAMDRAFAEFQSSAPLLKASGARTAPDAEWMLIVTGQKLAGANPKLADETIARLRAFKTSYPAHPSAGQIDLLILRLGAKDLSLDKLNPADPNYDDMCYLVCQQAYGQWKRSLKDKAKTAAEAKKLRAALERYVTLPAADKSPERKLDCLNMGADLGLSSVPQDLDYARDKLEQATPLAAAKVSPRKSLDYRFLKLQESLARKDEPAALAEAEWIRKEGGGSLYEEPALLLLAKAAEQSLKGSSGADLEKKRAELTKIYQRLAEIVGDTPAILKGGGNPLVISSRLAAHAFEAGDHKLAGDQLDKLLKTYPRDSGFLQRAGLAHFNAGRFPRAQECWLLLVRGLPYDSKEWLEAQYYYIACLERTNRPEAQRVFQQFKTGHPDLGPEPRRGDFQRLEKSLFP